MTAYVTTLNRLVEADAARCAATKADEADHARDRLSPLEDRLARLLATVPIELQQTGISLTHLQKSLRGRSRSHCHPGDLGAALRALGFRRERKWRGSTGFTALWYLGAK